MSQPKLISPLLDSFAMGDPISEHNGVRCCPAMNQQTKEKYIVKIISIPASQTKLDALLLTGAYANKEAACAYFLELANDLAGEAKTLKQLSITEGFTAYQDWQIVPMEDGTGFDVYLLGTYKRSLQKIFQREPMTQLRALNLGLDMCAALSVCRQANYLYVNLKPENIFMMPTGSFRIGDLGFISTNALSYTSLADIYRSAYTAPEIADAFSTLNETMDIYALGLILYQAYNNGALPFQGTQAPAEKFAPPMYADYEIAEIILKACDPNPEERWQTPEEMGQALVTYMQKYGANDVPIVPLIPNNSEVHVAQEAAEAIAEKTPAEETAQEQEGEASTSPAVDVDPEEAEAAIVGLYDAEPEKADLPAEAQPDETPLIVAPPDTVLQETEQDLSISEETLSELPSSEYTEDDFGNLSFLDDMIGENLLSESETNEITYDEVSEEVSQMLSQVDALAEHEVPSPVIAPEHISVPMPSPIIPAPQEPEEPAPQPEEEQVAAAPVILAEPIPEAAEEIPQEIPYEEGAPAETKKRKSVLGAIAIALLLVILIAAGYLFYRFYYLQTIDSLSVKGEHSSLTVSLITETDESLLTVSCADDYGNRHTADVVNGKAVFTDLMPNMRYTVTVHIDGFRTLTGMTQTTYNTPAQTNILQFSALTGSQSGSAVLSITAESPEGPDATEWTVFYSAEGEEEKSVDFTGRTYTLTDLTVGKTYTLKLVPKATEFVTGTDTITFLASNLLYAENLRVVNCADGEIVVAWDAPADAPAVSWKVHCFNASGTYSEMITTAETTVTFENLDHSDGYTVEVIAEGMTVSQRIMVEKNTTTITDFTADTSVPGEITLTWNASTEIPASGWVLDYTMTGIDTTQTVICTENTFVLDTALPETQYTFVLSSAENAVLCEELKIKTPEAGEFTCTYDGFTVSSSDMLFRMCKWPGIEDWTRHDLDGQDYTTSFVPGERAAFVVRLKAVYGLSDDPVKLTFVIRNEDGSIVSLKSEMTTWNEMWDMYYCHLDVPETPSVIGDYTLTVYFNGAFACQQAFTIAPAATE